MTTRIFVNLAVHDLDQSVEFFGRLGYTFNAQFTDETTACMIVTDDIYVMLLTETKFQSFTPNPVCDARKGTEAIVCLTCESRERVDEMVGKAVAAGGSTWNEPQDYGFMYTHGFQDPDGHVWELIWMAASAMNKR